MEIRSRLAAPLLGTEKSRPVVHDIVVAAVTVAVADVAAGRHVPAGLSDPERSTVGGLSPSIREVTKSRGPAEAMLLYIQ